MTDTMDIYAKRALEECNSATHTVRRGGKCGRPFWNINSTFPVVSVKIYLFKCVSHIIHLCLYCQFFCLLVFYISRIH